MNVILGCMHECYVWIFLLLIYEILDPPFNNTWSVLSEVHIALLSYWTQLILNGTFIKDLCKLTWIQWLVFPWTIHGWTKILTKASNRNNMNVNKGQVVRGFSNHSWLNFIFFIKSFKALIKEYTKQILVDSSIHGQV
jgi:hypothetical protein